MRSFAVCFLLVAASISLTSAHIPQQPGFPPAEPKCPPMWYRSGNTCLRFFKEAARWQVAQDFCSRFSSCATGNPSSLLKISSAAQATLIESFLTGISEVAPPDIWIGLNDIKIEGQYVWADGTPGPRTAFEYRNFAPGEPNDSSQLTGAPADCFIRGGQLGTWSDEACTQEMMFVCQMDLAPTTPTTGTGTGTVGV